MLDTPQLHSDLEPQAVFPERKAPLSSRMPLSMESISRLRVSHFELEGWAERVFTEIRGRESLCHLTSQLKSIGNVTISIDGTFLIRKRPAIPN